MPVLLITIKIFKFFKSINHSKSAYQNTFKILTVIFEFCNARFKLKLDDYYRLFVFILLITALCVVY